MPARHVVLTERQVEFLDTLVKSGRYQDASEVLREGLELVERREAEDADKLQALQAAVHSGVSALERGAYKDFDTIEDLQSYLNGLSDKIITRAGE